MNTSGLHTAILLLGSNTGASGKMIQYASSLLEQCCGRIVKRSSVYRTEPWGFESKNDFLNQVLLLETILSPETLLNTILEIEIQLGRKRLTSHYHDRSIDIDILLYDQEIRNIPELTIPHPRMHLRRFTLEPLNQVAPDYNHPIFECPIRELLDRCTDTHLVYQLPSL